MKQPTRVIVLLLSLSCLILGRPALSAEPKDTEPAPGRLFVATDGNDAWSGKLPAANETKTDGPLATLGRARDTIRQQKAGGAKGPFTVVVRGGTYYLSQTLKLDAQDSGTSEAPIVYRSCENEKATLVGGRRITGFVPHQGKIFKADVARQELKGVYFRQLFFNGKRQHMARFPNHDPDRPYDGGWSYVAGKRVPMYANPADDSRNVLRFEPEDVHDWAHPEEAQVMVFPRYNWWNNIIRVKSLDCQKRTMTLAGNASYPIRPGDRYYVRNLLEELDSPGEWYLDRRAWTVYFWPPSDIDVGMVHAPTLKSIVTMTGVRNVTLRGFTIECAEGTAISVRDSTDCRIAQNTIRNVGALCSSGISAVAVSGGRNVGVVGNDIYEVGSHAVSLTGGDRKTLTPARHFAENNYIHHTGVFYKQGVGVALSGVGNRASHNLIHDCPRFGVLYGGNDQIIEFNHIRHVDLETADTGATYSGGRDWLSPRGTVIRYNYFHDIFGYGREDGHWISPHYAWGIYLDDNSAEVHVIGNIVVGALRGLLHFHCGRDNLVENNIFVDGTLQQIEMNGWKDYSNFLDRMAPAYERHVDLPAWKKYKGLQQGGHPKDAVPMANNRLLRNIIYYHNPKAKLYKHGRLPIKHFQCDYNLIWHFGLPLLTGLKGVPDDKQWEEWQKLGFDRHSVVADPLFVDPAKGDYRLKPDSPALKLGFKQIPIEKIGPFEDSLRATWPIVEAPGMREAVLKRARVSHLQGEMTGEVTASSAILQSRLTGPSIASDGDVPGVPGVARFELADNRRFAEPLETAWLEARPDHDYIVKTKVTGLKPNTPYYYRLLFGPNREQIQRGPVRTFRTLPGADVIARTSFVVVTGMNHAFFHHGRDGKGKKAYRGADKQFGYPALAAIARLKPDFFVGTGDNVYYDHPRATSARTPRELRKKWHEQFVQPRFVELFAAVPTYWEKDDHDHRYNDCDTSSDRPPSNELGIRIFKEQVPVTDPTNPAAVTYRTHRVSKLLQIWLVEGRDYRSPNRMPDGPEKTLWGKTQMDWLKRTLAASDAPVKILISPTPMVGPDDKSKIDNHTDPGGFRHEGDAFFNWASENGLLDKGLYFVCGDRHWQYHSIHPAGFEEFSCGALVDANSRMGVLPGSKRGTDPDAKIKQPYTSRTPSGGFLNVVVEPGKKSGTANTRFDFLDEHGTLLHSVEKRGGQYLVPEK